MTRSDWREALKGGAFAGLIAGVVLALDLMLGASLHGRDVWMVLKAPAFPLVHDRAGLPGLDRSSRSG